MPFGLVHLIDNMSGETVMKKPEDKVIVKSYLAVMVMMCLLATLAWI